MQIPDAVPIAVSTNRSLRIDTLRGIAVFGILLVNVWSFIWGFESLRYGVLPPDASIFDVLAVAFVAFFAEQKFYPIFAYLFGAGFVLTTRLVKRKLGRWSDAERLFRRRLTWLLACGVAHGTLLWFGDILTVYSIVGFWVLAGLANARLRKLRKRLTLWAIFFFALLLFNFALIFQMNEPDVLRAQAAHAVANVEEARAIYTERGLTAIAIQRISDYLLVTTQSLFIAPHIAVLFLLGAISTRLGWLTQPGRHRTVWRRVRLVGLIIGIPFNLAWATFVLAEAINPLQLSVVELALYSWLPVGGTTLGAAYVASLMLAGDTTIERLAKWLAPVGKMALSMYLMQSLLCSVWIQGFGFGLGATWPPAGWLSIAFGIMLLQIVFSRWWLVRFTEGPIEMLSRRYINGPIPNNPA